MTAKYRFTTLGCKVNQYESQVIREVLEEAGLRPAAHDEPAAWTIINTCAVTGEAVRKSRQAIRRAGRGGQSRVVVVGCGASDAPHGLAGIPGVAAVLGHDRDVCSEIRKLVSGNHSAGVGTSEVNTAAAILRPVSPTDSQCLNEGSIRPVLPSEPGTVAAVRHPSNVRSSIGLPLTIVKRADVEAARIHRFDGHQRAFLKVQDGCDAFCTYCTIPRLRPRLASKPVAAAVSEARALVAAGHREIILTGIFLGAYGWPTAIRRRHAQLQRAAESGSEGVRVTDGVVNSSPDDRSPGRDRSNRTSENQANAATHGIAGDRTSSLVELVDAIAQIEGLERLRLSSLEPGDVDEALLRVLARNPNCVPHLHLPLQSGSEAILRRMNRQYTVAAFLDMIARVRSALDRPAISTDIIVGFPGETEADFERTLAVARESELLKIHAFPFSPREGTAAARWQRSFVPPAVIRERMQRLAALEGELSLAFRRRFVGRVERVIVEPNKGSGARPGSDGSANVLHGRCDRYFEIHFEPGRGDGMSASPDRTRSAAADLLDAPGPAAPPAPGDLVHVRIDRVTPTRTHGTLVRAGAAGIALPVLAGRYERTWA